MIKQEFEWNLSCLQPVYPIKKLWIYYTYFLLSGVYLLAY
jgi:hypothetical protein